jgi:hypothetical protein
MNSRRAGLVSVTTWMLLTAFIACGCTVSTREQGAVLLLILGSPTESSDSVSGAAVITDSRMNTAAVVPLTVSGTAAAESSVSRTAEILKLEPNYSLAAAGDEAVNLLEIFRVLESEHERIEGEHAASEFSGILYRNAALFLEDVVYSHIRAATGREVPESFVKELLRGAASGELELRVMQELRIDITARKSYLYESEYLAQLHRAVAD